MAEAGLLDGARATTHWALVGAMQRRYPGIAILGDQVLVDNDKTVCSGDMTSYLNLVLWLVERHGGAALASATAKVMLIDRQRVSQASYRSLTVQAQALHDDIWSARRSGVWNNASRMASASPCLPANWP